MERIYSFVFTGILYLIVVLVTIFFSKQADRAKKKIKFRICSILALLIPAAFAGIRGLDVGTDIMVYAYPLFKRADITSGFVNFHNVSGTEIGYSFIVYIGAHVFHSIQFTLFLTALMQLLPVYIGAVIIKKTIPINKTILVYMLIFYVVGFNIMRQSIAAGFIFLAFVYLQKEKYFRAIIATIIAFLFHGTAIFGLLTLGMFLVFKYEKKRKRLVFWSIAFFVAVASLAKYWTEIIVLMGALKLLPYEKVIGYSQMFNSGDTFYTSLVLSQYVEAFFKVALLFVCIVRRKHVEEAMYNAALGTYLMGVMLYLFFFVAFHTSFGYRISLFAEYTLIMLIPLADDVKGRRVKLGFVSKKGLLVWGTSIMDFVILFVLFGIHGTYPFRFFFE